MPATVNFILSFVLNSRMRHLLILFLFPWISHVYAQNQDSTVHSSNQQLQDNERQSTSRLRLSMKTIAFPLSLITYGAFSQSNNELREFDVRIKNVVRKDADFHSPVDNYMQYAPGLAVYVLNAIDIKGKNNFRDRTMIYLLSNVMMGITFKLLKKLQKLRGLKDLEPMHFHRAIRRLLLRVLNFCCRNIKIYLPGMVLQAMPLLQQRVFYACIITSIGSGMLWPVPALVFYQPNWHIGFILLLKEPFLKIGLCIRWSCLTIRIGSEAYH